MADTQPYRRRKRGFETAGDMARSLLPIVVLILIFAAFCLPRGSESVVRTDPTIDIQSAARTVGFPVYAPSGLAEDWVPTSSKLLRPEDDTTAEPNGLSIGYVTPDEEFARYTQQQGPRADVLKLAVTGAEITEDPDGDDVTVGDRVWTPVATSKGSAIVSVEGTEDAAIVFVIAGSADRGELLELAGSLHPATG